MSYEELIEFEQNAIMSYNDYVVFSIAKGMKEIEEGIEGTTLEETYKEIFGKEYINKENYISSRS